jgi:hypothetical protein
MPTRLIHNLGITLIVAPTCKAQGGVRPDAAAAAAFTGASLRAGDIGARQGVSAHADSLDAKAGVVLGFSGVLIGLGATAQSADSNTIVFQIGLGVAVAAAVLAVSAFLPRPYPTLALGPLRDNYLTEPKDYTRLRLLDTRSR